MEAAVHTLVLDPDVASEAGGGGEGTLTLVTWELLQCLHDIQIHLVTVGSSNKHNLTLLLSP